MPNRIPTPTLGTIPVRSSKTAQPAAKPPVGPAAVKAYQQQVSPKGVASAAAKAKSAIDKKYPGLYKSGK